MFKFLWNHNSPYKRLYPSFQARLFSALVDITLALLILISVFQLASFVGYDFTFIKRWKIINRAAQQSHDFKSLSYKLTNDPEYTRFIAKHGEYKSSIIDQIVQIGLFGFAIFIFWLKKYTTPGKMLLSMKIVDAKTFGNPSVSQLIIRLCSYIISFLPFGLGVFYIALNKKHRAWHDIISGTVVVNTRELKKYSPPVAKSAISY